MEYGLIGNKLKHSFSKIIHEAIGGYSYEINELTPEQLVSFMTEKNFKGINVTIPYKKDVIPYLDFIDESVSNIGACNVVVNKDNKLYGYNTDYVGFLAMLEYFDINLKNKRVAILGNGGAAATVKYACKTEKAKEVFVISQNEEDDTYSYADLYDELGDVEIIINTTPVGMFPNNHKEIIKVEHFTSLEAFVDIVYNPLKTRTVTIAESLGIKVATGLFMLVAQAVYGIEYFTGKELDKSIIKNYYEKLVKQKENVVLIGMPTSGKTTIGRQLAEKLNRRFIDIDEEIIKVIEMPISEYFAKYGETQFRYVEKNVIKTIACDQGIVIATGGGSVLDIENVRNLKQNGKIFFLNRSLENLITTNDRPLSSNRDDLKKRYEERFDIYMKSADVVVDGNRDIECAVNDIYLEVNK